jgi:outer membrane protein OmpA-like peptidoglycan-associated protein
MKSFRIYLAVGISVFFVFSTTYSQSNRHLIFSIKGKIFDDTSKRTPKMAIKNAIITLIGSDGSIYSDTSTTNGNYSFDTAIIKKNTAYIIKAEAMGYFGAKEKFTTTGLDSSQEFIKDFGLIKIQPCGPILPEVRFDVGEFVLSQQYRDSLKWFIQTMYDNPGMIIGILVHTNATGDLLYSDSLSYKRAKYLIDYFISEGIDAGRIKAEAYGERVPRILNRDTYINGFEFPKGTILTKEYIDQFKDYKKKYDAAIQLNNYVEFKILKSDYKSVQENMDQEKPEIIIIKTY